MCGTRSMADGPFDRACSQRPLLLSDLPGGISPKQIALVHQAPVRVGPGIAHLLDGISVPGCALSQGVPPTPGGMPAPGHRTPGVSSGPGEWPASACGCRKTSRGNVPQSSVNKQTSKHKETLCYTQLR